MMHGLTEVNKKKDEISNLVLLSMDISGMYPALDIPECAKIAAEMWDRSGMELNLNTEELGLYLALTVDRARLEDLGLADFCSPWHHNQGDPQPRQQDKVTFP